MICSLPVSKETQDKVKLAKKYIEDKYQAMILQEKEQKQNWNKIVDLMTKNQMPLSQKLSLEKELKIQQDIKKRLMRQKDCLKNYELYNLIGKGAFGEVRLAKNRKTSNIISKSDQIVAIKRMQKSKLVEKKQISSAYIEKELMIKNGDSKFLVKLHSTFQDNKYVYLVMEYVSGGDLLHLLIQEDIFSEQDTKFYIAELIVAIEQIHSKNFIHRDIKPDNILIDVSGHIKISDFGLSKYMTHNAYQKEAFKFEKKSVCSKNSKQAVKPCKKQQDKLSKMNLAQERTIKTFSKVGTPDYISPEVLTSEQYDYSIDIWSVGVIMFECLFGYPPFSDDDPKQVCQKVANWVDYLEFPDGFDVSIEAKLLMLGMINDSEKRLSIKQIKEHPFFFGIDWNHILKLQPPMIPTIQHELDTKNFEKYDQVEQWIDENQQSEEMQDTNKQGPDQQMPQNKINSMKKRSNSAGYLFAGFEYRNVPIEPFKFIENKINTYQKENQQRIASTKKIQPKSSQFIKPPKRFLTEDEIKVKQGVNTLERKISQKYILKMPQSPKSFISKLNQTTTSLLKFQKITPRLSKI